MNIFTDDIACTSHAHCEPCRNKDHGQAFRESLGRVFILPHDAPDFVCPHGKPWGWQKPAKGLGDSVARAIDKVTFGKVKPCGGCQKRKEFLNRIFPYREDNEWP